MHAYIHSGQMQMTVEYSRIMLCLSMFENVLWSLLHPLQKVDQQHLLFSRLLTCVAYIPTPAQLSAFENLSNIYLSLSYELGSGLAVILTGSPVNDGNWHTIQIKRYPNL